MFVTNEGYYNGLLEVCLSLTKVQKLVYYFVVTTIASG